MTAKRGANPSSKPLQALPGIGPSLAADLLSLGYAAPRDLVGEDPLAMFERLEELTGSRQDPCVLDAFRCAVYVAGADDPDPELSKWWTWSRLRKQGRVAGLAPQAAGGTRD